MRRLAYLPSAHAELVHAAEAVEELTERGAYFVAEVRRVEAEIAERPDRLPLDPDAPEGLEVRRARVGRFPWRLVFLAEQELVLVVAVAHVRREPGYWRERLG